MEGNTWKQSHPDHMKDKNMKDKEYYYLDTVNFELLSQKGNKSINLNSGVLSDETLGKVLKDIENNLKKTNKELM